jgi:hypothetical protein
MRPAREVLKELIRHVDPPRGCAIVLTECKPATASDPNWVPGAPPMNPERVIAYQEKVAELRKSDPQVDWSHEENRRVAFWASEI